MKPLPRFFRFHFSIAFFWAQIVVGVFAAEKPASPESPGSKQLDPGWPREVIRNSRIGPTGDRVGRRIGDQEPGVVVAEDVFATKQPLLLP